MYGPWCVLIKLLLSTDRFSYVLLMPLCSPNELPARAVLFQTTAIAWVAVTHQQNTTFTCHLGKFSSLFIT